jgi:predicted HAD superfamily phosphohydrolase YqeG
VPNLIRPTGSKAIDKKHPGDKLVGNQYLQDIFGAKRLGMVIVKVNQGGHTDENVD